MRVLYQVHVRPGFGYVTDSDFFLFWPAIEKAFPSFAYKYGGEDARVRVGGPFAAE